MTDYAPICKICNNRVEVWQPEAYPLVDGKVVARHKLCVESSEKDAK
jgi:hypothetical protein